MLQLLCKVGDSVELELTELQLDALREVGNIGAGNAATAMSQMIDRKVDMTVPQVEILPFNEMINTIGQEDELVVAVLLKVFGDAPGNILFIMDMEKAQRLSEMLLMGYQDVSEEMFISVFQEIGNILGNSYINAITRLTPLNLITSVPSVAMDMLAAVLSISFLDAEQYSDYVLAIDTKFIEDDKEVGGNFFFIPKPGSLNIILQNLGL
ncbi:chemotaxis protein CheC [Fervidicella metallireducens]|uniref:chemotaxis protein CheC n=1 Tax=Fervidicella metallireducens TaxID=655338 RepID=UPI0006863440|nr:chemotaxis protein CheC [Fervidicella metallireducens]